MIKKQFLTHVMFILGLIIITFIAHYPSFIDGKTMSQHDILMGIGSHHQLKVFRDQTGEEALWNPNLFGGMPAYLTGIRFSADLLRYAYIAYHLYLPRAASILFISMLGFYIMMLAFGARPWIAFMAGIAFGLTGFNVISIMAGHNSKIDAVALMPLVIAGIHLAFHGKRFLGAGLTAIGLGFQIRAGHPQITYYLVFIVLAYGINELIKTYQTKAWKSFGKTTSLLVLSAILAVGANFSRLTATLEYSKYTIRGKSELASASGKSSGLDKEYAFNSSNGIMEPLFLFVPNFFGGSSRQELSTKSEVAAAFRKAGYNRQQIAQQIKAIPTYWGSQPLTAPYYAGTLTVVLFVLGIVFLPKNQKVWLISLAGWGIVLSWGKNFEVFNELIFDYLPGYNKFRSMTFTIIITIFAMNLLGFTALEKLISSTWNNEIRKKLLITLTITAGFLVLIIVFAGAFSYKGAIDSQLPDWFVEALRSDRKSLLIRDSLRALLFLLIPAGFIWAYFKKNLGIQYTLLGIAASMFIDSFLLSRRFINSENFEKNPTATYYNKNEADQYLTSNIKPGERVLNLQNPFNENRTSYFVASIGGYHAAKMRRYQELIERCIQPELQEAINKLKNQSSDFSNLPVLNMLNTRYFYAGTDRNGVFVNGFANGAAWIVSKVIPVNSADEEIDRVCSLNTKNEAIVDQTKFNIPTTTGLGSIRLEEKNPNKLIYTASVSGGSATTIFSEIYYPHGWKATIDGDEAEILRANYVLRGLEIPEGQHEIIFEFAPAVYHTGNIIMLVSSILCFSFFIGGVVKEFKS